MKQINLAIYAMHPTQYHSPIFAELDKSYEINTVVLYADKLGVESNYNPEFKTTIKWDISLLDGYKYIFFKNFTFKRISGFFSRINPGMFIHILFNKYDVVMIHGYQTMSSWLVLVFSKISGAKIIFRGEALMKNTPMGIKGRIIHKIVSFYLDKCDAVMYSCSGNRKYLESMNVSKEKMFFIPCAVDNNRFQKERKLYLPDREIIREQLNIDKDDLVIIFAARFTKRKRPLDLIDAVSKIKHDNIVLLFVGDGEEMISMKNKVKCSNIRAIFTGFINQGSISKYYTISDIFVVLSSYDASPKALNEALNFGIPIISSNGVGTAEDLVVNGRNGFIVHVGCIEEISDSINKFNDKNLLRRMGLNSLDFVKDWSLSNDVAGIMEAVKYVKQSQR